MGRYLIIPELGQLEESLKLAKEYDLGFEVNDFYEPTLNRNPKRRAAMLDLYQQTEMPQTLTMHGNFYDVLIFSEDDEIREISEKRVEESILTARKLGASAVIFHTNLNPALTGEQYRNRWVDANCRFWRMMCEKYSDIEIYLENMFDTTPYDLAKVCEQLRDVPNFGVTFDYAHAAIYGKNVAEWSEVLAPYIRHVHISDNDGCNDLHLAVGSGVLDWEEFVRLQQLYFNEVSILIETAGWEQQCKSLTFMTEQGILVPHK